jgi:hypothetical protein
LGEPVTSIILEVASPVQGEKTMNKQAIEQVAFHDRMAVPVSPGAGLGKFTAAVAALCANKLRRHLGASESLGTVSNAFEHSVPPQDWADGDSMLDSVMLTGFADSVSDDEVGVTLEVRAESAAHDAVPLARAKLVFSVHKPSEADRRRDLELRELVNQGALLLGDEQHSKGMRTMRAFAAAQALGALSYPSALSFN